MPILIVCIATQLVVMVLIIGCALAFLRRRWLAFAPVASLWAMAAGVLAILDIVMVFAVGQLDATITIRDAAIANALEMSGARRLDDLVALGWFDVASWIAQASLATWLGIRAALTSK